MKQIILYCIHRQSLILCVAGGHRDLEGGSPKLPEVIYIQSSIDDLDLNKKARLMKAVIAYLELIDRDDIITLKKDISEDFSPKEHVTHIYSCILYHAFYPIECVVQNT